MKNTILPLPSAPRLLTDSLRFYINYWKVLLPIAAIPVIPDFFNLLLGKNPVTVVIMILDGLISYISTLALLFAITRNGTSKVGESYSKGFKLIIPVFWIGLLSSLATMGGFLLLIIPGILLSLWLRLSIFALFAENLRGTKALTRSWYLIKGYSLSVFWRFLFIFLIWIPLYLIPLGTLLLPFILSSSISKPNVEVLLSTETSLTYQAVSLISTLLFGLVVTPIISIYPYLIYQSLKEKKPQVANEEEERKLKKKIIIFTWLGILFFVLLIALAIFAIFFVLGQLGSIINNPNNSLPINTSPVPI